MHDHQVTGPYNQAQDGDVGPDMLSAFSPIPHVLLARLVGSSTFDNKNNQAHFTISPKYKPLSNSEMQTEETPPVLLLFNVTGRRERAALPVSTGRRGVGSFTSNVMFIWEGVRIFRK